MISNFRTILSDNRRINVINLMTIQNESAVVNDFE